MFKVKEKLVIGDKKRWKSMKFPRKPKRRRLLYRVFNFEENILNRHGNGCVGWFLAKQ